MPFTPYHMGPGLLIKSLLQSGFSLMIFGWAQILMDIQPLIVLLMGQGHLHGFSHTYLGATLIAFLSAISGKYLIDNGLIIIKTYHSFVPVAFTWRVVFTSAFLGTYTHVLLDSIMHADMKPLFPFVIENKMLGIITLEQLHQFCWYSGLIGVTVYVLVLLEIIRLKK